MTLNVETILNKLRYKKTYKSLLVNLPEDLRLLMTKISSETSDKPEFTILFIRSSSELDEYFIKTIEKGVYDSVFWLAYPKKSSKVKTDVTRDTIWESIKPMGYRPVSIVSLNETWSAMRIRPTEEVSG